MRTAAAAPAGGTALTCGAPAATGCACAMRCCKLCADISRNPPPLPRRRDRREPRAAAVHGGAPLHLSRLSRESCCAAGRAARCWCRCPARRSGLLRRRLPGARDQRVATRQHSPGAAFARAADHHQGQSSLDRASPGLSRLHRRQALRRARPGDRRGAHSGPVDFATPTAPIRARCRGCATSSSACCEHFPFAANSHDGKRLSQICRRCRAMNCSRPACRT